MLSRPDPFSSRPGLQGLAEGPRHGPDSPLALLHRRPPEATAAAPPAAAAPAAGAEQGIASNDVGLSASDRVAGWPERSMGPRLLSAVSVLVRFPRVRTGRRRSWPVGRTRDRQPRQMVTGRVRQLRVPLLAVSISGRRLLRPVTSGAGELPHVAALPTSSSSTIMQSLPAQAKVKNGPAWPMSGWSSNQSPAEHRVRPNPGRRQPDGTVSNTGAVALGHGTPPGGEDRHLRLLRGRADSGHALQWPGPAEGEPDWSFINEPCTATSSSNLTPHLAEHPGGRLHILFLRVNLHQPEGHRACLSEHRQGPGIHGVSQRHRKLILTTSLYQAGFGAVDFRCADTTPLARRSRVPSRLLNRLALSTGDVDFVALSGGGDPGGVPCCRRAHCSGRRS